MNRTSKQTRKAHLMLSGGHFGCLPVTVDIEYDEDLPDDDQFEQMLDIVRALIAAGYEGLKLPGYYNLGDKLLLNWPYQIGTPEGDYFSELCAMANSRVPLPSVVDALAEVAARYRLADGFPEEGQM